MKRIERMTGAIFGNDLRDKLNEIIDFLNASQEKEEPMMKDGQEYWYITTSGEVSHFDWDNGPTDKRLTAFNNIFKTREEAESARDKVRELLRSLKG